MKTIAIFPKLIHRLIRNTGLGLKAQNIAVHPSGYETEVDGLANDPFYKACPSTDDDVLWQTSVSLRTHYAHCQLL